jgi:xanthine dehydrogenase YagR molybdenum-binding subunit
MADEITIQVGFGDQFHPLTVRLQDGDIPPWQPGQPLDVVGQRKPRLDAVAKVTGTAKFSQDQRPDGLIHGRILRSPHGNAEIRSIDLTAARAMPGVRSALTVPDTFEDSTARYCGAEVAAIAADTEQQADAAMRAIVVDYQVKEHCVTIDASMAEGAPQVGRGEQKNVQRVSPRTRGRRRGQNANPDADRQVVEQMARREKEVDAILAGSDSVVEGSFRTQVQTHAPLETHGAVCSWEDGRLVCWASTQATFGFRGEMTSDWGQVKASECRVLSEYVGGGFGSKFSAGREGVIGALLAREAGVPVKMMLDRSGEQTSAGNRPDSIQKMRMGVNKDGIIQGLQIRSWGTPGSGIGGAGAHNDGIYQLGEIDKVEYGVRTNCGGAKAHRAPGWPQGSVALEQMMDMAAHSIDGIDPIEFRKMNDDHPIRAKEYDIARERIGWDRTRVRGGSATICSGVGIASNLWFSAGGGGASALVRIAKDGAVEIRNGAQDIGTGTRTVMAMVAAEELGIPLEMVSTRIGDTNDPQGPMSGGSTTIGTLTPAARLAAHHAKKELLAVVAERKGWDPADLDLRKARVIRNDGSDTGLSFKDACSLMDDDAIEVLKARPRRNYAGFSDTNAGVQAAEVEVDMETGVVRVKKVVAVADAGKLINPMTAESQVRGGVIQGVSFALHERRIMDRHKGRMLNDDLENYKILGSVDCPEIDVVLVDVYNGKSNTQVMGLGEPPIVATAAAVANAVADAIGVRVFEVPITPRRVLEAIASNEKSAAQPKKKGARL